MKSNKIILKIIALLMAVSLVMMFSGCSSDNNEKSDKNDDVVVKYDIISARYIKYEENEVLDITYIDSDGEYQTESAVYRLKISDENKVILTNPDSFFGCKQIFTLTVDTYNEIINASPNIYKIK